MTRGRPALYTAELAERILQQLSRGRALGEICRDAGMPYRGTVRRWVNHDCEGFAARYDRARQAGRASARHPTLYTPELADRFLHELSSGRSLRDICRDAGMPAPSTVRGWIALDREGFATRYAHAFQAGHPAAKRPASYSSELADHVLLELSAGRSLGEICGDDGMPDRGTVRQWVKRDRDGFAARYARARATGQPATGRPSLYTAELAERLLQQLTDGRSLHSVCGDRGMPAPSTVRKWEIEDREGFAAHYGEARAFGCEIMSDEIIDIADDSRGDWIRRVKADGTIQYTPNPANIRRAKLRTTARCWQLAKSLPRIKGDRRGGRSKPDAGKGAADPSRQNAAMPSEKAD